VEAGAQVTAPYPQCLICDCLLHPEVDGAHGICVACRHEDGIRGVPLSIEDRVIDGEPIDEGNGR
jgi:hypothetical protein